jgi:DNA segregation ATPase FtsK/SpoIIIE, S-DNA-T family
MNRRNKFKSATVSPKKSSSGIKSIFSRFSEGIGFLKSKRFQQLSGGMFFLLAIYFFIAFTSFVFTWRSDQDKIMAGRWEFFTNADIQVENWLGKLGAIISHQFIHNWFGFSSFLFVFLFFLAGFRLLFDIRLLSISRSIKNSLFLLVLISVFFGFFFSGTSILGGSVGFQTSNCLISLLGKSGTGIFIVFVGIVYLSVVFKFSFTSLKPFLEKIFVSSSKDTGSDDYVSGSQDYETKEYSEKFEFDDTQKYESELEDGSEDEEEFEVITLSDEISETEESLSEELPEKEKEIELDISQEEQPEKPQNKEEENDDEFSVEIAQSDDHVLSDDELNDKLKEFGEYDPKLDLSSYQLPTIDLLNNYGDSGGEPKVSKEELEANKNKIVDTLSNYKIDIDKIKATIGPTVTLYEIVPAPGVRISKIKNLEDDIALSLSALGIRIIAPIAGKGTVGIEVPNSNPDVVSMRTVVASDKFQNADMELPLVLGKTISNETFTIDLAKMPHLLMAGATGQGKSVGLNAILVSLLYKKHPAQVKFVLVDPKKVELTLFNKIERHFLAKLPDEEEAIITDTSKVVPTLNSLCKEMDDRYELLKEAQVRNIKEYNSKFISRKLNPEKGHRYLPYIVLVVDEFADLIMTAGKEVETPIARLAQLARAIGIHLIIATQRPSVNIITGTIKANFPARIAFRVTSKIDSRTILDAGGADQLIGRGDMLLSTGSDLIRIQCAFVDTPEVEEITNFIGNQRAYPEAYLLPEVDEVGSASSGGAGGGSDEEEDDMFEEAARVVVINQQGSTSLIQRKLKLGYNRAGRIMDQLEAAGVVGPFEGSKARKVLIPDEYALEQFLKNRGNGAM